jgi:hypothetical protein
LNNSQPASPDSARIDFTHVIFNRYGFLIVFAAALLFYLLTAGYPLANGDGAQYTTLAAKGDLLEIPSHLGHIALGWLMIKVLPFVPPEYAMQFISILFGAIGVAATYQAVVYHTQDRVAGWLAALALLIAGEYWFHATTVEVYAEQAGALMAAYTLWLYAALHDPISGERIQSAGRAVLLGALAILFAILAALVSPSSVAFLPMLLFGRKVRIPRWVLLGGGGIGLAAVISATTLFADELLAGREIVFGLHPALRSLALAGVSMGLPALVIAAIIMINGLHNSGDPQVTRRTRRTLWLILITGLVHLPFGGIIATGPYIPVYGLVALAFGLAAAWLRRQTTLPRRAIHRAVIGFGAVLGLAILGYLGGCELRPAICRLAARWLVAYDNPMTTPSMILALVSLIFFGLWLIRHTTEQPHFDHQFTWVPLLVIAASASLNWSLDIYSQYQIAQNQIRAVDLMQEVDPPAPTIIGSYNALMLYDYYHLGHAYWETEHVWVDELSPEALNLILDDYGEAYLLGRYGRRYAEEKGDVDLDAYQLVPLDGEADMLWKVTRRN